MEKLIECSQAGVKIELFIRGICSLRPGVTGLTENITVKGVIGRWLEHSRIYSFGEGKEQRLFIGSGDLLNRNLERRVEAFVEITTADTREQIHEILNALRADKEKSRVMQPNGSYLREPGGEGTSSQEALYQYFSRRKVSLKPEKPKTAEKTEEPKEAVKTEASKEPEKAEAPKRPEKPKAEKPAAKPARLVIQSPFGKEITPEEVLEKVGEVDTVYIRVDQNKAYWVRGKEYGSVDLW
jgi:polyphosphate kinase